MSSPLLHIGDLQATPCRYFDSCIPYSSQYMMAHHSFSTFYNASNLAKTGTPLYCIIYAFKLQGILRATSQNEMLPNTDSSNSP